MVVDGRQQPDSANMVEKAIAHSMGDGLRAQYGGRWEATAELSEHDGKGNSTQHGRRTQITGTPGHLGQLAVHHLSMPSVRTWKAYSPLLKA